MLEQVAASGAVVAEPVRPLSGSAVFFDFDDAAPGYPAYDLAVFLRNLLEGQAAPTGRISSEWSRYPGGYRRRRELALP